MINNEENKTGQQVCIFIGRSGCGKGTQVELYIKKLEEINGLKTLHIETGALLRELAKNSSYTAQMTKNIIGTGGLMPESIVIGLWISYLTNNFTGKENLVFDGAPRKLEEAILLDSTLAFYNIQKYKVVHINVSKKWATERLLARARGDDTKEGIAHRMRWYDTEVMKSIKFFKKSKNCEFIDINGEQTIEQVHDELMKKVFKKYNN
ncbi:MAG: nucleoside monophosphate kinase [Candidatus Paceibacterota bacterium]|jgi:adenylate kinase family enzyme